MSRAWFTPSAEKDLEEIVDYIATEASADRARAVLDQILRAADLLAERPGLGHVREDLTEEDVLFWPVYSYLIVYRPQNTPIEVVRVLSGWRDVKSILSAGS